MKRYLFSWLGSLLGLPRRWPTPYQYAFLLFLVVVVLVGLAMYLYH